ncbi:MAG TPA: hypothetical protein DCM86_05530, partial [Verrucomicrobiales bacterium]|nr:hypothetical protein [Verrucomicrobiales bacterium]
MQKSDSRETPNGLKFVPLAVVALLGVLYLLTLDRWISLENLGTIARASGWEWYPIGGNPLWNLLIKPFGVLPVTIQPMALSLLSLALGLSTLALLARTV